MPDVLSVILRALSFVLLFQTAGVAIFVAIFGHRLASSQILVRRLGQAAAIAGVVLVGAHFALEAARMAGDMSGMWDPELQGMAWNSPARAALICRMLGLLLIALGLQGVSVGSTIVAVVGAVLSIGAFALTGHTSVNPHRGALAALLDRGELPPPARPLLKAGLYWPGVAGLLQTLEPVSSLVRCRLFNSR